MGELVYVDNSNVFIEGQRVSAVRKDMAMNIYDALNNRALDFSYRIDFGKLHSFVAGDEPAKIKRALLFGSRPPPNDQLWYVAEKAGFDPIIEDRNIQNKEKRIDTGLSVAMTRDAYTMARKEDDTLTLVGGDGDYVPLVESLVGDGFKVCVVFWDHASRDLRNAASEFISLNPHLEYLAR